VFQALFTALNANKPSYVVDSVTYTYSILSAFPEVDPNYPCIVINPISIKTKKIGINPTVTGEYETANVEIEFYAKTSHGKNAIDGARDSVEETIKAIVSQYFYLARNPFDDGDNDIIEFGGVKLNTASMTVFMTLR
jgi:hypothetical protein